VRNSPIVVPKSPKDKLLEIAVTGLFTGQVLILLLKHCSGIFIPITCAKALPVCMKNKKKIVKPAYLCMPVCNGCVEMKAEVHCVCVMQMKLTPSQIWCV